MDAERWKRVDDLLQAALRVPTREQEKFLRQQCGGDSELLEEVRSLLTSHRQAGSFLESPGVHVAEVAAQLPTLGGSASGSSLIATGLLAVNGEGRSCRAGDRPASLIDGFAGEADQTRHHGGSLGLCGPDRRRR